MVWFKVDDKFHSSVEVMSIPAGKRAAAVGLWCLAGAWSSDQLKDGYVPMTMISTWGGTPALGDLLVAAKLWTRVGKSGYRFRNWSKWQVTRDQVENARDKERQRKADWREAKAQKTLQTLDDVPPVSPLTRPDQTRPDQTNRTKTDLEGGVGTTGPFCSRHPGGTEEACGACRTARLTFEAARQTERTKPTKTPRAAKRGDGHNHVADEHGNCPICGEKA